MDPAAPGNKTSEFTMTIAVTLVGYAVALIGLVHPGFQITQSAQLTIASVALALIGWIATSYTKSRTKVKVASLAASAMTPASPATPADLTVDVSPSSGSDITSLVPASTEAEISAPVQFAPATEAAKRPSVKPRSTTKSRRPKA